MQNQHHPFPEDFLWGASTSAFQVEGGFGEGAKAPPPPTWGPTAPALRTTGWPPTTTTTGKRT